jgi:hypothetical protein
MRKFWMMSGAIIAVTAAAVAWHPQPVRSSEGLLGKAQAEFATRARDALIARRMAQAPTAPAVTSAPSSVPTQPYVVASLEPIAPPTIATREATVVAVAPVPAAPTSDSMDAPVESTKLTASPEFVAAPKTDDKETTEPQIATLPAPLTAESAVTPKPAPVVAPTPELATVTTPVVTTPTAIPTDATPRQPAKVAHKAHATPNQPNSNTAARRSEQVAPRYSTSYSLDALRARSPELAAAIARYM